MRRIMRRILRTFLNPRFSIEVLLLTTILIAGKNEATSEQQAKTCDNNSTETTTCLSPRAPPQILSKGVFNTLDSSSFEIIDSIPYDSILDGDSVPPLTSKPSLTNIQGGEKIKLQYVKDIVSPEIASKLIEMCDKRSGWTASPQVLDGQASVKASRTSRSCPLIWPQLYLPYLDDPSMQSKIAPMKDEITITWHLIQRIASFLNVGEEYVEPFQLVRYQPGEFYKKHHDHGSYYGVSTEQRPMTLLVFLTDVPSTSDSGGGGGYTKFEALDEANGGLAVVPRMGDGVLWMNEDDDGNLLLDAVHEAVPPVDQGNVIKYAMNVWIAKKKIRENLDLSSYRTYTTK